jgi:dihydrolipoamide dehydrogenase
MQNRYDLVVIGAGPGGYVAAIRAGQLGMKTAVIEREYIGGVCLNWGCIPSKALLHVASLKREVEKASKIGLVASNIRLDTEAMRRHKDETVKRLTGGVRMLLGKVGVGIIEGEASFASPTILVVKTESGVKEVGADRIIIACGSRPIDIPSLPLDGEKVIGVRDALEMRLVPERLGVVGGGFIGVEMATVYQALGSEVTILEMLPTILPTVDADVVKILARELKKRGVRVRTNTKVESATVGNNSVEIAVSAKKGQEKLVFDQVLVAVGMRPDASSLKLEKAGVKTDRFGFIPTNEVLQTNVSNIYAIGDITGGKMLAHKASREGIVCVEAISGKDVVFDDRAIPFGVFTDPEIGTVGLTEEEAKEAGHDVKIGVFPHRASGKAIASGHIEGMVKIVADTETDSVLGVHIIGPHAADLIAEAALAMELGATVKDIASVVHVHPTISEAVMEAAANVHGEAIHVVN